jgi:hypothetical protein
MLRHGLIESLPESTRERGQQKGVWPETIAAIKAYQITQHKNAVYQASDHHWFTEQRPVCRPLVIVDNVLEPNPKNAVEKQSAGISIRA